MAKFRAVSLTGGGDIPGYHAMLYGMAAEIEKEGGELIGLNRGWAGPLTRGKNYTVVDDKGKEKPLTTITGAEPMILTTSNIDPTQGGSIILSSRANPPKIPGAIDDIVQNLSDMGADFFLPIGGDDTNTVTAAVAKMDTSFKIMAMPKTIDNDIGNIGPSNQFRDLQSMVNIWTPGFPTAVSRGTAYAESSLSTTYTHERVMLDEAMGRKAGFLALAMGTLSGADFTLLPEEPIIVRDFCERVATVYTERLTRLGNGFVYGVISEGVINAETGKEVSKDPSIRDDHGQIKLGGASKVLAKAVKEYFTEHGIHAPYFNGQVPEYMYRGGSPNDTDREAGIALGRHAIRSLLDGVPSGNMATLAWDGEYAAPKIMPLDKAVTFDEKGKIQARTVPIDRVNPENGFYNASTWQPTELGKQYAGILGVPKAKFSMPK